ncbi:cytochrome P450 [Aspergillus stella-maris]|uniref:cytochrome P450 n=1 Tax=Aspergillus stella-maris TaxID=1810926 RepID=UPI003CCE31DB
MSLVVILALAACFLGWLAVKSSNAAAAMKVPTVSICRCTPDFINRLLYVFMARRLIYKGYNKYKDTPYRVRKVDADLIVLPAKYLPYIRQMDHTKISLLEAQYDSVCGDYTHLLHDSNLPSHTVSRRLTPALSRVVPKVIDELKHAFQIEVPECKDKYVPVNLYYMILYIVTRATSRIIVGDTVCRSQTWLDTVTKYTENLGTALLLLRPLPPLLRPLIASFLPQPRYLKKTMRWVKEGIFIPVILERREKEAMDPDYQKPDDFIQWIMDGEDNESDADPGTIAQGVMIIIALAVVHTSSMLITQGLFDLLLRPEYLKPLREEINDTLKEGWENATKQDFAKQIKLDSFLRESQRLNPTSEVNVQRIVKETLIFPDGFTVPEGTHIVFPAGPLSRDPTLITNPGTFDGLRWCPNSSNNDSDTDSDKAIESKNDSIVTASPLNLHFGYGRQACPGRHFASATSKALLSKLLVEYDIKPLDSKQWKRPTNIRNGEQIMPNLFTKVLIRRREVPAGI